MEKVIPKYYVYDTLKENIDFTFKPYDTEEELRKNLKENYLFRAKDFIKLKPVKCYIHITIREVIPNYEFDPIGKAIRGEEIAKEARKALKRIKEK